ncbi:UDP-glucuronosyltransferase 1-8 [Amphibalanus amphitrite]|uniref:UDP-glucuronosyltransferase n=1 Tax=Amphibalanus amphitrite TaxID=1232801 RepID=A0A6A4WY03_AMPAM|nr:UDP-glucuronosyltransferase 1-8 [Amphibalanus amphitrite]
MQLPRRSRKMRSVAVLALLWAAAGGALFRSRLVEHAQTPLRSAGGVSGIQCASLCLWASDCVGWSRDPHTGACRLWPPASAQNPLTPLKELVFQSRLIAVPDGFTVSDDPKVAYNIIIIVAKKFGDGVIPPALEIEKNASLVLLSSNPAVHYHQPLLPNTIQVGGMHCLKPKPLPKELTDFLGDSEFVYFSLGSVIKPQDMSLEQKAAILAALGSLPYKVLLKWDTTDRTGLPANILPSKWLPQQDILGSSKCRLFISHGGFASVLESLCHGVPLVTMPGSGDQQFNAVNAVSLGVAELLSWDELTAESLRSAMAAALSAERLAAARHRQRLMAEQPVPPRDLAVHWVEHVMRHGGAPHLRSVGAELNFFQYYSLDVLAFLLGVLLLALKLLIAMLKCCCRCVCVRRTRRVPAETKSKAKRAKRD